MSKISWAHAELCEQAYELGFESLEDAINNGYEARVEGTTLKLVPNVEKQMELAHKEWLEEKKQVLNDLDIVAHADNVPFEYKEIVKHAIKFVEKGEY